MILKKIKIYSLLIMILSAINLNIFSASTIEEREGDSLISVARSGNVEELRKIIAKRSNINAANWLGITALMYAADSGDIDMAKLLLCAGADIDQVRNDGKTTAIDFAKVANKQEIVKLLEDEKKKRSVSTR